MLLVRFAHFFGMCLWLGGMVAAMVIAVAARSESVVEGLRVSRAR